MVLVSLFEWLYENGMKSTKINVTLCNALKEAQSFHYPLAYSGFQKLLGVTSEKKLTSLHNKANQNIQVLIKIFPCVLQTHKRLLINGYLMSQFGYYPLVWINHSRILNKRIKELRKRNFSLLYNKFTVSFF